MTTLSNKIFERLNDPSYKNKTLFNWQIDSRWQSITYDEFLRKSLAISGHLIKAGVKKGERVMLASENRYEWCMAYLAILNIGAIAVPVDTSLSSSEIRTIIIDSESRFIFHSEKTMSVLKEALEGINAIRILNFDSSEFEEINLFEGGFITASVRGDDLAMLVYTSGTTGIPKAVMLTHENLSSDAHALIRAGIITQYDNILSALPLYHTYSLMCTFLVPLLANAEITYPVSLKGPDLISAIREREVTIFIGVPKILEMLRGGILKKIHGLSYPVKFFIRLSDFLRRRLNINTGRIIFRPVQRTFGHLRYITSGGARLEPEIMRDIEALGFTVLEGYGLTETSPVVTFNPPRKRKPGSVGRPLEGVKIKIINPSVEGIGEVTIKGPMLMKGYWRNPKATTSSIKNGWLLSGDLGYIDKDGYLFLTGRSKEVIVLSSGKNVYPEEVENLYSKIPLIKEICVMADNDRLTSIIVPNTEYAKREKIGNINEALKWEISKVSQKLPPYMRLMGYTLYPHDLPKTPLGKLKRFLIKDLLKIKTHIPEVEDRRLTEDAIGKRVISCILPLLEEKRYIQSKDNLELDLGLDSLKRLELIVSIEKEFSIKLPDSLASEIQTVEELIERIKETTELITKLTEDYDPLKEEPSEEEKKRFKRTAFEGVVVTVVLALLRIFFKLLFRLRVSRTENIPSPPFIIASNHTSYIDGFVIASGLPLKVFKTLYFQGYQKYFRGRLTSCFARLSHVILIDPETYLSKALQASAYVLRRGNSLLIFPEGGRSFNGKLMEFKKGIGILALSLNVPVIPTKIDGTYKILPRGRWFPRLGSIRLTFGRPIMPSRSLGIDLSKKQEVIDKYQFFANLIRQSIEEMI